jgi:hypothetical protein
MAFVTSLRSRVVRMLKRAITMQKRQTRTDLAHMLSRATTATVFASQMRTAMAFVMSLRSRAVRMLERAITMQTRQTKTDLVHMLSRAMTATVFA